VPRSVSSSWCVLVQEEGAPSSSDNRPAASEDTPLVKRYRRQYEACKTEMDESRRQLALVNAEVARLERELAAASMTRSSPAPAHAVDLRG